MTLIVKIDYDEGNPKSYRGVVAVNGDKELVIANGNPVEDYNNMADLLRGYVVMLSSSVDTFVRERPDIAWWTNRHSQELLRWLEPRPREEEILKGWTNTETEVVYYWLVRDKRLVDRLEVLQAQCKDGRLQLAQAAKLLENAVLARVLAWHNNKATGRIGYTTAIRNMYAVVFYPYPKEAAKRIKWAELVQNHSDNEMMEYLNESGEVSL